MLIVVLGPAREAFHSLRQRSLASHLANLFGEMKKRLQKCSNIVQMLLAGHTLSISTERKDKAVDTSKRKGIDSKYMEKL